MLKKVIQKIFPPKQARRVKPWFNVNGDKTLRLNYDLKESSIVFDLGGYEGQWASDIYSMYNCRVLVFEPFPEYAANIRKRFARNKNIEVFEFGLGKSDFSTVLYTGADATSQFRGSGAPTTINIKEATKFIQQNAVSTIDLMKVNIEGGEYDLIDGLIETGAIKKIRNLQVQFHDFVDNAESRMKDIQVKLRSTHDVTYEFEFVWENWKLKETQ